MATETNPSAWTPSFDLCELIVPVEVMLQMFFKREILDKIMLNVSSAMKVVAQFNDWLGKIRLEHCLYVNIFLI